MTLPLHGIKVLDLTRMLPGPYCSMILADLGAEVIRVEDPNYAYLNPPPFYQKGKYRESAFNSILMRNKKSITLNLKKEKAREIFYELVKNADVVLETYRPKVTNKLMIDYDTLSSINPSIIYCSLTGYGQDGPYNQLSGHDLNYISICGILNLNRERSIESRPDKERKPIVPGIQAADIGGGLVSAIGILSAIIERDKNPEKRGQYLDIAMTDCVFSFMPMAAANTFSNNKLPENFLHGEYPFYSVYKTKDNKYLSVGIIEMKFWEQFCEGLDLQDLKLKQFAKGKEKEDIFKIVQEKFLTKTQKEWLDHFKNFDTCLMQVNNFAEACNDPQIIARNMVVELDHPKLGKIKNVATPIKMSKTPLKIRNLAPKVGQHTKDVLRSLNYSDDEIRNFKINGLI